MVARIGEVTARMHAALASRPADPAFPSRAATVAETAAWRASAERQLALAVSAVGGDAHERMVAIAPAVTARFADTFGSATGEARGHPHPRRLPPRPAPGPDRWRLQRHRLRGRAGAAARTSVARRPRRCATSPACCAASTTPPAPPNARSPAFDAEAWLAEARAAFIGAYGGIGPAAVGLLEAFELEKACYEVRYEASNRPDWLWLPLAAVERLSTDRGARVDGPGTLRS